MRYINILFLIITSLVNICYADINLPDPAGYVSDYAGVLDPETKEKISSLITEVEQKTSAEIAVVVIKTLEGDSIEDYSVKLFKKFGIGKKDKNNGVLLLVAIDDRKARIEVGYGLEGILPDGLCGEILRRYVLSYFKQADYSKGLFVGSSVIANIIAKDANVELTGLASYEPVLKKTSKIKTIFNIIFFIILIIFFIRHPFLSLMFLGSGGFRGGSSRGGFGGGGGFGGFGGGFSGGGGASGGW